MWRRRRTEEAGEEGGISEGHGAAACEGSGGGPLALRGGGEVALRAARRHHGGRPCPRPHTDMWQVQIGRILLRHRSA
jgi:hypothetical protein